MNKYLFGIFAIILTFAGKSFAAPLDAYYCFSTHLIPFCLDRERNSDLTKLSR